MNRLQHREGLTAHKTSIASKLNTKIKNNAILQNGFIRSRFCQNHSIYTINLSQNGFKMHSLKKTSASYSAPLPFLVLIKKFEIEREDL